MAFAILFRLIFFLAIPNLSQDFYRFIWDGRLILEGLNPYISLPKIIIQQNHYPINQALQLYQGMGEFNGSHYTNYPPLNQFCFFIAAIFANKSILGSVIVMRTIIIFADIGIFYFGVKLLKQLKLSTSNIFLYALNPFVIIELTGNLHFESVMLFFLIFALYKLQQQKWIWAAILFACSIAIKLIPLLFLPLFYQWFIKMPHTNQLKKKGFFKLLVFYALIILICVLLFSPFYSPKVIPNYLNSVGLWFRNFEFNASFYYIARKIGYAFTGYNQIAIIGKIIFIVTVLLVLAISVFRKNIPLKNLITAMLFTLSFYYFISTTIHPWYLASLLVLAIFTNYRFPFLWSMVVVLSYQAYANIPWKENLWLVGIEYGIVYVFLLYELKILKAN
ncbi:mannosyltransferase [Tenacibaculum sp. UWU-22]|uniref:mannosyltransferase n=1 Tax=Tenacibaculum sp. UWU-22 TaxID=3234187 RepID=UPI0034DADCDC